MSADETGIQHPLWLDYEGEEPVGHTPGRKTEKPDFPLYPSYLKFKTKQIKKKLK